MRLVILAALLATTTIVLAEPAFASDMGGYPVTLYLTAACATATPAGCVTPRAVVLPDGTTVVALKIMNNGTAAIRLDACSASGGGSNATTGAMAACPAKRANATSNVTSAVCPAGGMGGTNNTATNQSMNRSSSFPVKVPGCSVTEVALTVPAAGDVSILNTDTGEILVALSPAPPATGGTPGGNVTTTTTTTPPTNRTQESNNTAPSKGTPGFEATLALVGVGAAAFALARRKK
jgi:PGF-CTERM protein